MGENTTSGAYRLSTSAVAASAAETGEGPRTCGTSGSMPSCRGSLTSTASSRSGVLPASPAIASISPAP
ncbi:hypothetical protein [Kocuria sp. CNJ-770]|uniref:hypothetical protein n=1 Tax=Kocuria sp. CNJ-770 TaxID=1904964 RepID=UPI00267BD3FB